jgi:hypothetical protein
MTVEKTLENTGHDGIRIHIDGTRRTSPNPTTGKALYTLGHVRDGFDLYREVGGDREDPVIHKGAENVDLHQDEHFHSGPPLDKEIKIFVNGREYLEKKRGLTYHEVVALPYPNPDFETHTYKVTYFRHHNKHEGVLEKGQSVKLTNEMVFTVIRAIRS